MSAMTYQCDQLCCGWSALGGKRKVEGSILRLTSPRQAAYRDFCAIIAGIYAEGAARHAHQV